VAYARAPDDLREGMGQAWRDREANRKAVEEQQ